MAATPPPLTSVNPRTGEAGPDVFAEATPRDVDRAVAAARAAFDAWRSRPPSRAGLLRAIAEALGEDRDRIVATADVETGLGSARLAGELERTTGQLRMFAELVDEGSFVEAILSPGDPRARPPRPDIRRMLVPIGPVAVFTPSNFPLAFGAAGGDTASALAAGCPVVVKGHPSHPATSEACARAVAAAVVSAAAPAGVFSLIQARDVGVSSALVTSPGIRAVAFTGSLAAGRAIFDRAAARPDPIPVHAEMGSVNPVFVASGALAARAAEIADGLSSSITQGAGQFCTKPGLVFLPDDDEGRAFARELAEALARRGPGLMLNAGLSATLDRQLDATRARDGVRQLTPVSVGEGCSRAPVLLAVDADTWSATPALLDEHFGPCSIVVFSSLARMLDLAGRLPGSLTATIHAEAQDRDWSARLTDALSQRVGRIVWNGFPTGVAVVDAMHHGGPYPASTSAEHTSVGSAAVRRFLRPVAWQNAPADLLPDALRDENPLGIQRRIEGVWTRA